MATPPANAALLEHICVWDRRGGRLTSVEESIPHSLLSLETHSAACR